MEEYEEQNLLQTIIKLLSCTDEESVEVAVSMLYNDYDTFKNELRNYLTTNSIQAGKQNKELHLLKVRITQCIFNQENCKELFSEFVSLST